MVLCIHCTQNVSGGRVVHSYGRLIPHEFPITDLQQISGPDGIGRITCTVSSGTARFAPNGGQLETGGVSQTRNGATVILLVNPSNVDNFQNRELYCTVINTNFLYLFISSASKFPYYYYNALYKAKQCIPTKFTYEYYIKTNFFYLFISSASTFPHYYYVRMHVLYKAKQCIPNN